MKRTITYITLLLFAVLPATVSCSHGDESEDDDNVFIQYRINVAEPVIAGVIYRDATGNLITEEGTSVAALEEWYEFEHVEPPFNAHKQVRFVNNGAQPVPYTLSIFVEGELIKTEEGHVAPQAEEVALIEYNVSQ
ncbi:hypothetical protein [Flavobacterium subsaxonicum]|uniref:Uncharacterized protein n=1 Tax=Flavobacterium subsaxonicum WB 4.1-42 = DSM 21790 TaxID=1121898 RepID=A0A0A2N183_9FLAO|nr:hypothetical protein [Flavobacterium subsaxonicum]KGO94200.1 hypothetical protein Q766_04530 [Flavobacterium subsaxonicum WB 4.1-42 = DSM 21790]